MLRGGDTSNKTEKSRKRNEQKTSSKIRPIYRKAGMGTQATSDDSIGVNVHGAFPTAWIKLAMLVLNLAVWIDAAAQLAR